MFHVLSLNTIVAALFTDEKSPLLLPLPRLSLPSLQSETPSSCFARLRFISEFTGSAGTAIITSDRAAFWTDGRYFLQVRPGEVGPGGGVVGQLFVPM